MGITSRIGETSDKVIGAPIAMAQAATEMLAGKNPAPAMKDAATDAIGSVLMLPLGLGKDLVTGVVNGTMKLGWNILKFIPLPMIAAWKGERSAQTASTHGQLEALSKTIG